MFSTKKFDKINFWHSIELVSVFFVVVWILMIKIFLRFLISWINLFLWEQNKWLWIISIFKWEILYRNRRWKRERYGMISDSSITFNFALVHPAFPFWLIQNKAKPQVAIKYSISIVKKTLRQKSSYLYSFFIILNRYQ